jgi:hypothetical protein
MYYSYVEIEYVATSYSPARTDLALKLLNKHLSKMHAQRVDTRIGKNRAGPLPCFNDNSKHIRKVSGIVH